MPSASEPQKRVRPLYAWEVEQASLVFGDQLRYDKIRIHEGVGWPDAIDRIGRWLKRLPAPSDSDHNAVTLGFDCYFPVWLPESLIPLGQPQDYMMGWLIHELTHAWQFQHFSWRYLFEALSAQFRLGALAYDFGGLAGLIERRQEGWTFYSFNREQQGDITRTFYYAQRAGQDVSAWQPYIYDLLQPSPSD